MWFREMRELWFSEDVHLAERVHTARTIIEWPEGIKPIPSNVKGSSRSNYVGLSGVGPL